MRSLRKGGQEELYLQTYAEEPRGLRRRRGPSRVGVARKPLARRRGEEDATKKRPRKSGTRGAAPGPGGRFPEAFPASFFPGVSSSFLREG